MIKFDKTHESIEGNIEEKRGIGVIKRGLALGLAILNIFLFSACSKQKECNIKLLHAHRYVDKTTKLGRFIVSEKNAESWMGKRDEVIYLDENDKDVLRRLDFANRNGLFKIDENYDVIKETIKDDKYHYEYEYKYHKTKRKDISVYVDGEYHHTTVEVEDPEPSYDWTDNVYHANLTGKVKVMVPVYQGFKIDNDPKRGLTMVSSEYYYGFEDIPEEYEYIRSKITRYIALYDSKEIAEYLAYISDKEVEGVKAK